MSLPVCRTAPHSPRTRSAATAGPWLALAGVTLLLAGCGADDAGGRGGRASDGGAFLDGGSADLGGKRDGGPADAGGADLGDGGSAALDAGDGPGDSGDGPDDAGATALDATPSTDAGPLPEAPERSCSTTFSHRPQGPVTEVFAAGDWDWQASGWVPLRDPDGDGVFTGARELPAGLYAYKLVLRSPGQEDRWLLDPTHGYRKYSNGVENSGLRVGDCRVPQLELRGSETTACGPEGNPGAFAALVQFVRGAGGPPAAAGTLRATLRQGTTRTPLRAPQVRLDASGRLAVALDDLGAGKYVLELALADEAGTATAPLLLPFWIEAEPFDWRDSVIQLVLTDRFRDGDRANNAPATVGASPSADWQGGDFAGVRQSIDEGWFDRLGVRVLWLTPFNRNPAGAYPASDGVHQVTGYHGYWPVRAREVDPRLGTAEELEALVAAAHRHGIRVLMDLVLNQVHVEHEYVAAHPAWFRRGCICGTEHCDFTTHRLDCLFAEYMPDIDWTVTEGSEQFIADALWWQERFDLDGFRVDAVKHVEDLAVSNLALRLRERFDQAGTHTFLLGETAMGWNHDCETVECNRSEYETINRYVGPGLLDGQLDFVLYHATAYRVLAYGERGGIHLDFWTLASQQQYLPGAIMSPYLGSHDTPRFLSLADFRGQDADHPRSTTDRRWSDGASPLPGPPADDEPYARSRVAHGWLLTLPGAPLLYAGDEYGEFGGADPDNRHLLRREAELRPAEAALLAEVRRIGQLRRELLPLRRGSYTSVRGGETFLAFARHTADQAVLVTLNLAPAATREELVLPPGLPLADGSWRDALHPGALPVVVRDGRLTVDLPPQSVAVWVPETR